jgi:hypothetical protein
MTEDRLTPTDQIRVERPGGPAVGTLAWGLVTLAVAGLVLAREVADLRVDLSIALPVGMVALGVLLVVGAVVTGLRGRDGAAPDDR